MIKVIVGAVVAAALVAVTVAYFAAVQDGSLPPPDWNAILGRIQGLSSQAAGGVGAVVAIALVFVGFLAAIAPLVFAIRSGDGMTVLVCLVLVVCTWAIALNSRTSIDLALAGCIYIASMTLAAVVFAMRRIVDTLAPGAPVGRWREPKIENFDDRR